MQFSTFSMNFTLQQIILFLQVVMCQEIQVSVFNHSQKFLAELSRYNYVTPTSYLELLGIFSKLVGMKKTELNTARNRLKTGLDKLLTTADEVAKLSAELETMKPLLAEAVKESVATMEQISKDTVRRRSYNYNLLELKESFSKITL